MMLRVMGKDYRPEYVERAILFYEHLKNHPEVQEADKHKGIGRNAKPELKQKPTELKNQLDRTKCIRRIAEETEDAKNCEHIWRIHDVKRWFAHAVFLYCSKCGSWKKIL